MGLNAYQIRKLLEYWNESHLDLPPIEEKKEECMHICEMGTNECVRCGKNTAYTPLPKEKIEELDLVQVPNYDDPKTWKVNVTGYNLLVEKVNELVRALNSSPTQI